jgi:hypothetical protein
LAIVVVVVTGVVVVVATSAVPTPLLAVVPTTVVLEAVLLPTTVVTVAIDLWPVATVVAVTPVPDGTVVTVVVPVGCTVVVEATVEVVTAGDVVVTTGDVIVTAVARTSDVGPVFDDASSTEPDRKRSVIVPSEEHVTVMTTERFAAPEAVVMTQPVAVPIVPKSPATIPDTASENVNV